jgi:HD-like signal output (HDOD) protein
LNVLLVDDEPQVLDVLRRQILAIRPAWQVVIAADAEQALEEFDHRGFDAVVTDLHLPGMDGASLLDVVQRRFPEVCRVAMSGYVQLNESARVLQRAHQHVSKPCRGPELAEAVERALARRDQVRDEALRRLVGAASSLPSAPRLFDRISRILADPDSSLWKIADAIEEDPALSAKVLQIANSAYLGLRSRISSIEMAASMLGTHLLRGLVLATEVFEGFGPEARSAGYSVDAEQRHAVRVARLAAVFEARASWREDAFSGGLLHDIGRLLLASRLGPRYVPLIDESHASGVPLHVLERDQLGTDHAEVGGYLLGLWGLPDVVVHAVARHHEGSLGPDRALDAVLAVSVANQLDRAMGTARLEPLVEREAARDARWLVWAETAFDMDRLGEAA